MAIYHMQAKVVSRGSGRSAVAASAYMSCSRMYNDYDGIQHDYTRTYLPVLPRNRQDDIPQIQKYPFNGSEYITLLNTFKG